jgi:hypothetical protein
VQLQFLTPALGFGAGCRSGALQRHCVVKQKQQLCGSSLLLSKQKQQPGGSSLLSSTWRER